MSSGSYGVFSVRIFSLSAGDVRKGSMFARCNFDNFKKFETNVVKKTSYPEWETECEFKYTTQYADRLRYKTFAFEVYSKKMLGTDFIGVAKVSLDVLLSGPVSHELTLWNKSKVSGTARFKVEMHQQVRLKVFFTSLACFRLPLLRSSSKDPSTYLRIGVTDPNVKAVIKTKVREHTRDPEWDKIEQLRFTTTFKDLMSTSLMIESIHRGNVIAMAKLPFANYTSFTGDVVKVSATMEIPQKYRSRGDQDIVELQGKLYYQNFPKTAQMIGGIHTDTGIEDGILAHDSCPVPPCPVKLIGGKNDKKNQQGPQGPLSPPPEDIKKKVPQEPKSSPPPRHFRTHSATGNHAQTQLQPHIQQQPNQYVQTEMQAKSARHGRSRTMMTGGGQQKRSQSRPPLTVGNRLPWYLKKVGREAVELTLKLKLPAPWTAQIHPKSGRTFYINHETRTTHWSIPKLQATSNQTSEIATPTSRAAAREYGAKIGSPIRSRPAVKVVGKLEEKSKPTLVTVTKVVSVSDGPERKFKTRVDQTQLQKIVKMGFIKELAHEALLVSNGRTGKAVEWLLSTKPNPLPVDIWDIRYHAKSKRVYYANNAKRITTWVRPTV
ncbi:hypothetical protein AAMO2058_000937600 [Amorphochlora amoebiformis]|uniref:HECT-type E3 ubiquitin transferase n=1 Tax=Amorphochlora amoebiformis TaxID=1561963 RepID=A0A7S0DQC8_9EUKA|mmetsp:Transcript_5972/g.9200  ORF Transcript_5972/g.9200 Transcript_5972/m.9200 type:complete len:605 (+) Transcript_5972:102-1916(+)